MTKKRQKKIAYTDISCFNDLPTEDFDEIKRDEYFLSEHDRITVVFGNKRNAIKQVINVSYEALIYGKWVTLVRFDSAHGSLHRHTRISIKNPDTTVESVGLIKKGTPKDWLTWSRKFLNKTFYDYKVGFCKRSNVKLIDL